LLTWVGALTALPAWATDEALVRVCYDADSSSAHRFRDERGELRGAAFELVQRAFERARLRANWLPMPWVRCQREAADASLSDRPEVLFFGSRSAERERDLVFTRALHVDVGGVWYSRRALPKGPLLHRNADLARYRLCGKHGGNFGWLAALGVPPPEARPLTMQAALSMVMKGHCELFLFAEGPVRSAERLGQLQLPVDLAFEPYPEESRTHQHLMVARSSERADSLRERLDAALASLQQSGEADRIYQRYTGKGTGLAR
jgi:polar amino acid transport system substrate-binding protein